MPLVDLPPEPVSPLLETLGQRVRGLRHEQGFTLAELARRSGLSVRFLSSVEQGRANISVLNLAELATTLGVPLVSLLEVPTQAQGRGIVALLGLRGAGKSTLGAALARKWRVPFHELDRLVEVEAGMTLAEIFAIHGEAHYRETEHRALRRFLGDHPEGVLATGGGLVTAPETFRLLRERARTLWLKATPEEHWQRVVKQGDLRPMLNRPQAKAELRRRLTEREPLYGQAELTITTSKKTVAETIREVEARLKAFTPARSGG